MVTFYTWSNWEWQSLSNMPKATLSTCGGARIQTEIFCPPARASDHFSRLSFPPQPQSFWENASASRLTRSSSYVDSVRVPLCLFQTSSIFSQRPTFKISSSHSQSVLLISLSATLGHESFSFFLWWTIDKLSTVPTGWYLLLQSPHNLKPRVCSESLSSFRQSCFVCTKWPQPSSQEVA